MKRERSLSTGNKNVVPPKEPGSSFHYFGVKNGLLVCQHVSGIRSRRPQTIKLIQQQNGNVSWQGRTHIKQLAWPMAERQIGHRKSCLVLSARFPVANWRSRPVAKSAY